jgi:hypothetical protein
MTTTTKVYHSWGIRNPRHQSRVDSRRDAVRTELDFQEPSSRGLA